MSYTTFPLNRRHRLSSYIRHLSGLVAYYPLDEESGSIAYNHAPDTLGTLDGTTTGATIGQPGQVGNAYSFDGVNDEVAMADNDAIDFNSPFSVFVMLNPSSFGTIELGNILYKSGGFAFGWALTMRNNSGQSTWRLGCNNATFEASANGIVLNTWQMIGFTYDKSLGTLNIKHYRNGAAWGTGNNTTGPTITADGLTIQGGGRFFPGSIQHVMLFNSVLPPASVLRIARIAGLA